jgi:hypothetical protein
MVIQVASGKKKQRAKASAKRIGGPAAGTKAQSGKEVARFKMQDSSGKLVSCNLSRYSNFEFIH